MNQYKLRQQIKIKTIIPIIIIFVIMMIAVGLSIESVNNSLRKLIGIIAPIAVFMIVLFVVHGYAAHMALVEKEEVSDFIKIYSDAGTIGMGVLAAAAFLGCYITSKTLIDESLLAYYNVAVFFIAIVQVLSSGFCLGECNKALRNKTEYEVSTHHAKKAEKYKYMYILSCFTMIGLTYLMM